MGVEALLGSVIVMITIQEGPDGSRCYSGAAAPALDSCAGGGGGHARRLCRELARGSIRPPEMVVTPADRVAARGAANDTASTTMTRTRSHTTSTLLVAQYMIRDYLLGLIQSAMHRADEDQPLPCGA